MNERILELAEQAWDTTAVSPDFGHPVSFAKKFAELIVRECDRYVAEHYDECEPWMQPGDLLKHFGVE